MVNIKSTKTFYQTGDFWQRVFCHAWGFLAQFASLTEVFGMVRDFWLYWGFLSQHRVFGIVNTWL
jgi:hypothetical protein